MRKMERVTHEDNDFVIAYDYLFPHFEHIARMLVALGLEDNNGGVLTLEQIEKEKYGRYFFEKQ